MSSRYDVLQENDSADETSDSDGSSKDDIKNSTKHVQDKIAPHDIPSHEDLSLCRSDEETVLRAVYRDDFSREDGVWGCPRFNILVKPPDLQDENIGSVVT